MNELNAMKVPALFTNTCHHGCITYLSYITVCNTRNMQPVITFPAQQYFQVFHIVEGFFFVTVLSGDKYLIFFSKVNLKVILN